MSYPPPLETMAQGIADRKAASDAVARKVEFSWVEGVGPDMHKFIHLRCPNGHVVTKRRDGFLPGGHVAICIECSASSSKVRMLNGEILEIGNAAHRG